MSSDSKRVKFAKNSGPSASRAPLRLFWPKSNIRVLAVSWAAVPLHVTPYHKSLLPVPLVPHGETRVCDALA